MGCVCAKVVSCTGVNTHVSTAHAAVGAKTNLSPGLHLRTSFRHDLMSAHSTHTHVHTPRKSPTMPSNMSLQGIVMMGCTTRVGKPTKPSFVTVSVLLASMTAALTRPSNSATAASNLGLNSLQAPQPLRRCVCMCENARAYDALHSIADSSIAYMRQTLTIHASSLSMTTCSKFSSVSSTIPSASSLILRGGISDAVSADASTVVTHTHTR